MTRSKTERYLFIAGVVVALFFGPMAVSNAMHIMEGYLPLGYCVLWGAVCVPFFIAGLFSIKRTVTQHRKTLILLVMMGAYVFVLSALKIPSVTGSSSHPTGTGLGAVLFGPASMCVIGVIVLLFQALLLAHGGLTTLGANTFSMAIAGPFLAYGVFLVCKKLHAPKSLGIFLAACLGDLFTYCITAVQLAMAHPSPVGGFTASLAEFMGIFAVTQIPLAVIEGLVAVVVMKALESYAKPELTELGYLGV
ncbi:energy-coupling factor ABC transporter permease [Anaerovorax odorimutans]|uniref:Cobalt transport protein CbiM n=1 Tax=Anaerovorax odorimutans TaxID=109327 RepID=A0ABT1RMG7_9FIRM|nr:energy-coupling factor ABC transporter permease [Anaerovorax odorimutans]MCQ4636385.1 energy-coupling factor ABC transporter permease [Anaerovorax odorimutans]